EGAEAIFVVRSGAERGDEELPHAAVAMLHGRGGAVPAVEIANDGDGLGIGRPDSEAHAFYVAFAHRVRTQHAIALVVRAFGVEVQLEGRQGRSDGGCL